MGRKGRGRGERRECDSVEFPTLCLPPWCLETLETTWPNKPWAVPAIYCVPSGIKMVDRGKCVCPFSERLASRDGLEINLRLSFPGENAQCLLPNWFSPSSSHWGLAVLFICETKHKSQCTVKLVLLEHTWWADGVLHVYLLWGCSFFFHIWMKYN